MNTRLSWNTEDLREHASVRAAFCSLLSACFIERPDEAFVDRLLSDTFASALEAFVKEGEASEDVLAGIARMSDYIESAKTSERGTVSNELGVDRTKLYRGVAPNYGPLPPVETVWTSDAIRDGSILHKLIVEYDSSNMKVSAEATERPDYLGIELEYYRRLIVGEENAWSECKVEDAQALLAKQKSFLAAHLENWVPRFIESALPEAKTDFYRGHLLLLKGFLSDEAVFTQAALEHTA